MEQQHLVYDDLKTLLLLYKNGDLPQEQVAFPYRNGTNVLWAHRDELQKLSILDTVYPAANTQRGK